MKKFFILGLYIAILLIMGCKKDENKSSATGLGTLTYDGITYELDKGVLIYVGDFSTGTHLMNLTLCTSGIWYDPSEYGFRGIGDEVVLGLYSSSATELPTGTYSYSDIVATNQLSHGYLSLGANCTEDTYEKMVSFSDGTVTIVKTGSTYEITITGQDEGLKAISVTFKGQFNFYED